MVPIFRVKVFTLFRTLHLALVVSVDIDGWLRNVCHSEGSGFDNKRGVTRSQNHLKESKSLFVGGASWLSASVLRRLVAVGLEIHFPSWRSFTYKLIEIAADKIFPSWPGNDLMTNDDCGCLGLGSWDVCETG